MKLVTTLIANTKGEGKAGDDFWVKAETLLYTALIGYIHYEAPMEEQNFSTLIEFINAMEVREDDEDFKNPVDLMFDELKKRKPDHFAVRQYTKFARVYTPVVVIAALILAFLPPLLSSAAFIDSFTTWLHRAWGVSCGCCNSSSVRLVVAISGLPLR